MAEDNAIEDLTAQFPALRNWTETLTGYLDCYMERVNSNSSTNFTEAAFVVDNSTTIYRRRVDLVHQMFQDLAQLQRSAEVRNDARDEQSGSRNRLLVERDDFGPLDFVASTRPIDKHMAKIRQPVKQVLVNIPTVRSAREDIRTELFSTDGASIGYKDDFALFQRDLCNNLVQVDGPFENNLYDPDFERFTTGDRSLPMNDNLTEEFQPDCAETSAEVFMNEIPAQPQRSLPDPWEPMELINAAYGKLIKPIKVKCTIFLPNGLSGSRIQRYARSVPFPLKTRNETLSDPDRWIRKKNKCTRERRKILREFFNASAEHKSPPIVERLPAEDDLLPNWDTWSDHVETNLGSRPFEFQSLVASEDFHQHRQQNILSSNEMARKIEEWHRSVAPALEEAERRKHYDPAEYSERIVESLADGGTKSFRNVIARLNSICKIEKPEIGRYFFSVLDLATRGQLTIEPGNDSMAADQDPIIKLVTETEVDTE